MDRREVGSVATTLASVACAALLMIVAPPKVANAVEIVPSVGITRSVESGSNDVTRQWGLALRGPIVPHVLKAELGGSYRSEERNGGLVDAKMWPITASLLVTPIPVLYAGGGVGWYHTTLEYQPSLGLDDETTQDFGVHVGGGMNLPLAPGVGLDLGGRYVFMQDQESKLVPQKFNPDFWTLSAGLALGF
jgi:outer membrane protein with beta-barrel domain